MKNAKPKVAIIGAGWAGLSAAVHLSGQTDLTVFEAGREPGGRARRVALDGQMLDNGQHILIGAYRSSLALMRRVGVNPEQALLRLPLTWHIHDGMRMRCPALPAPWHLALALLGARGITLTEKWRMARALQVLQRKRWLVKPDISVADWLSASGQGGALRDGFWRPLVLSALNTPLEQASLATLAAVLADSLGSTREDSDLLLPRCDLSELLARPAWDYLVASGAAMHAGRRVQQITADGDGVRVDGEYFDAAVVALAPYHVSALLPDDLALQQVVAAQTFEPITTVYLHYLRTPRLPLTMCGLRGGTAHWLFDREALTGHVGTIAAVISCSAELGDISQEDLIVRVAADIRRIDPAAGEPQSARVVTEKRATFAAYVGRPLPQWRLAGLRRGYLAGDWTHSAYPATLEGAVQSGESAARLLLRDWNDED